MHITIKGGTPQHGGSLCATCRWVHQLKGYRESEEVIVCTFVDPKRAVSFSVRDCNHYRSSITPSPQQMEGMALIIPVKRARKPAGFAGLPSTANAETDDKELISAKE